MKTATTRPAALLREPERSAKKYRKHAVSEAQVEALAPIIFTLLARAQADGSIPMTTEGESDG